MIIYDNYHDFYIASGADDGERERLFAAISGILECWLWRTVKPGVSRVEVWKCGAREYQPRSDYQTLESLIVGSLSVAGSRL